MANLSLSRIGLLPLAVILALAGCDQAPRPAPAPAPAPPPEVVAPPPAPEPTPEARFQLMTTQLRGQLASERARRQAIVEDNLSLYRQIRKDFVLPETLAAAWDWITKACAVGNGGAEPGEIVWDERLGLAVVQGREPRTFGLPLGGDLEIELRWVEPGSFWMGSLDHEAGRNADELTHEVALAEGFWLGTFEVTQAQWQYVMGGNPAYFPAAGPQAPVEQVSWRDAQLFLVKLNTLVQQGHLPWAGVLFRLPTEAEWEYACRAGTTTATYAGDLRPRAANDCPGLGVIAWYGGNAGVAYAGGWDSSKWTALEIPHVRAGTHPVGLKQPNAWGFYDMLGNVWEWCDDRYVAYRGAPATPGHEASRVARGASWGNQAAAVRAAIRNPLPPDGRHPRVGFRVAAAWTAD
jgi:sulfatase modifying factor 1